MARSKDEVNADLYSGEPARICAAIAELKARMTSGEEISIPPFGVEILDPFCDQVPEEIQLDFITLIARYHSFVPERPYHEKIAVMVALVLRYAERYVAFEVAMKLKIAPDPVEAVKTGMGEMARRGLTSLRNVKGAMYLVSRLLDGKDNVRRATLESLREWPDEAPFFEVIEYVKPQLEPDELDFLKRDVPPTGGP